MAEQHRLEPLLAWRASDESWEIPLEIAAVWQSSQRRATLQSLTRQAGLRVALGGLSSAGIAAVALKGPRLAWRHYPSPALRPMRDLDLLVQPGDALRAWTVLEDLGFRSGAGALQVARASLTDDHQLPAQESAALGVAIELHHRLTDPPGRHGYPIPQLDAAGMIDRAETISCGGVAVPCPSANDLAAHLIVHALYGHRLDCGPLVLADLHFLSEDVSLDWDRLWAEAQAQGWTRGAELLLTLTAKWFGPLPIAVAAPPDEVLAAAEDALLPSPDARTHASAVADLGATESARTFLHMVRRRLVPDPEVVASEGGGLPRWAFYPLWAARRSASFARTLGNPRIRREARSAAQVVRWTQD